MRQSIHENKSKRRDRHDDVVNVGTSRGVSRRTKSKGEPIAIPTNKDSEIRLHKAASSRIGKINELRQMRLSEIILARMQTSQSSRAPERSKLAVVIETPKSSRQKTRSDTEDVIEIDSDQEVKHTKSKRLRLVKRASSEEEDDFVPEADEFIPIVRSTHPRRRTLHSPLNNFSKPRTTSLIQSVEKPSEFQKIHSTFDTEEDKKYDTTPFKRTSLTGWRNKINILKDRDLLLPRQATNTKSYKEEELEETKVASPVILPYDPIDDYEIEPVGQDEHFLTYPFNSKKSVTVYDRDFERLNEETYINDTLVDVFPKIWADEFPDASIYTFSSFFFTKLSGPYNTMHYDTVKRWTANEDIFKKRFVIIPVAQHNHWFLIVVMNPGYCIQGKKSEIYHPNFTEKEEDDSKLKKQKKKTKQAGTPLDSNKPYIVPLDPLHLNKPGAAKLIIRYLKEEAITKLDIDSSEFLTPEVVMPACPGQDNFTDCGVFCLHYMKSLYQYTDEMTTTLYTNSTDYVNAWDKDHTLPGFRTHLKRILKRKMKEYRQYLFSKLE